MKRVLWLCLLLLALTLVPATGAIVYASTSESTQQDGDSSTPAQSGGGGDAVCEADGDPDDIIDGNRQDNGEIGLGESGGDSAPIGDEDWELLQQLIEASVGLPY